MARRQHKGNWVTTAACHGVAQSGVHHAGTHSSRSLSHHNFPLASFPPCARSASRGDGAAEVEAVLRLREADRANSAELPAAKRRRVHDGGTVLAVRAGPAGRLFAQEVCNVVSESAMWLRMQQGCGSQGRPAHSQLHARLCQTGSITQSGLRRWLRPWRACAATCTPCLMYSSVATSHRPHGSAVMCALLALLYT